MLSKCLIHCGTTRDIGCRLFNEKGNYAFKTSQSHKGIGRDSSVCLCLKKNFFNSKFYVRAWELCEVQEEIWQIHFYSYNTDSHTIHSKHSLQLLGKQDRGEGARGPSIKTHQIHNLTNSNCSHGQVVTCTLTTLENYNNETELFSR